MGQAASSDWSATSSRATFPQNFPRVTLCMLPQELISMVFDHLFSELPTPEEQRWLASISHLCRHVSPAVRRLLYRAPYVYGTRALALFFRTLEARPDLALNVIEPTFDDRVDARTPQYLYVIPWTGSAVPGSLKKKSIFIETIVQFDNCADHNSGHLTVASQMGLSLFVCDVGQVRASGFPRMIASLIQRIFLDAPT
jgi:hypothetical protein